MNKTGIVRYKNALVDVSPELTTINIDGITTIGSGIANNNDNVISIDLSNIRKISGSFNNCTRLSSVILPSENK